MLSLHHSDDSASDDGAGEPAAAAAPPPPAAALAEGERNGAFAPLAGMRRWEARRRCACEILLRALSSRGCFSCVLAPRATRAVFL